MAYSSRRIVIDKYETRLEKGYLRGQKTVYRKDNKIILNTERFLDGIRFSDVLLPKNTKFHNSYFDGLQHIFITEYEPAMRSIKLHKNQYQKMEVFKRWCERKKIKDGEKQFERMSVTHESKQYIFQVLIPYTVIYTMVKPKDRRFQFQIFMRNTPLTSFDDMLYKIPLYNIQANQYVCMGSTFQGSQVFSLPIAQMIDEIYGAFWSSESNTDYDYNIRAYRYRQIFNNYFIWEYQSRYDPISIFKTKYVKYMPLKELLLSTENRYGFNGRHFKSLLSQFR